MDNKKKLQYIKTVDRISPADVKQAYKLTSALPFWHDKFDSLHIPSGLVSTVPKIHELHGGKQCATPLGAILLAAGWSSLASNNEYDSDGPSHYLGLPVEYYEGFRRVMRGQRPWIVRYNDASTPRGVAHVLGYRDGVRAIWQAIRISMERKISELKVPDKDPSNKELFVEDENIDSYGIYTAECFYGR